MRRKTLYLIIAGLTFITGILFASFLLFGSNHIRTPESNKVVTLVTETEISLPDTEPIIRLEKLSGECSGCDTYKVSVYPDGKVLIDFVEMTIVDGIEHISSKGTSYESKISEKDLNELVVKFKEMDFIHLSDRYVRGENCSESVLSDSQYAHIYYREGNKSKSIKHYLGCTYIHIKKNDRLTGNDLDKLEFLEQAIDKIGDRRHWVR